MNNTFQPFLLSAPSPCRENMQKQVYNFESIKVVYTDKELAVVVIKSTYIIIKLTRRIKMYGSH